MKEFAQEARKEDWAGEFFQPYPAPLKGGENEAEEFLSDLAAGNFLYKSRGQGDVLIWGTVGKYSDADHFVELLMPFWRKLLDPVHDIIQFEWQKILVVYAWEIEAISGVIDIGWDSNDLATRQVQVRRFPDQSFRCL
ncbi:MAG: hypothetical protein WAW39_13810 [Prosthecobacter sp.]|uniref:hypothetical protein n=1 Tax=Prosthecobacter sp. TaxID=1965333 RepID=UPI003BB1C729